MQQRWDRLTFLHWRYDPEVVQRLLPDWLTVETCDGSAWVALVPFDMVVATGGGRTAPWVSRFAETNVRTYARDAEGRSGVWFLSLDAARLGAVVAGRQGFGLPYYWSDMTVVRGADRTTYTSHRRWPGPRGTRSHVAVGVGPERDPAGISDLEHFLTARWHLFSEQGARRRWVQAWHDPWPLREGTLLDLDDELVVAGGLPAPEGEPWVHVSDGVDVRIGPTFRY